MDSTIKIWNIEVHSDCKPEKHESDCKGHTDYVVSCAWQPSSNDTLASLASSDKDKTCRLWDVRTSRQVQSFSLTPGNVDCCFSPDGQTIAVSNNRDNTIVMLDLRKGKAQGKPLKYSAYGSPYKIRWMSSNLLLVGSSEGSVNVHSLPDLALKWPLKGHTGSVYSFDVSEEKMKLASGGGDGIIAIWDLDTVACTKTITRADGPIKDISISSCGNYLAYVSEPLPSGQDSSNSPQNGVIDVLSVSGELLSSALFRGSLEACCWSKTHMLLAFSEESRTRDGDVAALIHICAPPRS